MLIIAPFNKKLKLKLIKMSTPIILPDSEALIQIKEACRKNYLRAFGQLRKFVGEDFSTRAPSEEELLQYFKHLREDKKMSSSSLWTTYSMINGMCKGKFSCNLKQYCRVTSLIKSFDVDIKESQVSDFGELWDDWNPTGEELRGATSAYRVPMKIESGAKVFYINKIENFKC